MEKFLHFKPDKGIITKLQSRNEAVNLMVLEEMSALGRVEYLPHIINLAVETKFEAVKNAVFNLLNQIKDNGAVSFLAEAIVDEKNRPVKKHLIEACWQNGLNYAQYLPLFTGILIHDSDENSFEAFTVIENLDYMPGDSIIKDEIKKIQSHMNSCGSTRQYFLTEAIKILEGVLNQDN